MGKLFDFAAPQRFDPRDGLRRDLQRHWQRKRRLKRQGKAEERFARAPNPKQPLSVEEWDRLIANATA